MANTYDTTLLPIGTNDFKALSNNASNFDDWVLGPAPFYPDRKLRMRLSWSGFESQVTSKFAAYDQQFNDFLTASGFEPIHLVYVDGSPLTVDRPTQLIDRAGISYRIKLPSSFPVVLSGTWATDLPLLVDVADAALRQDLASFAAGKGDAMLAVRSVGSTAPFTQHQLNATTVNLQAWGALDDYDGATPITNSFTALSDVLTAFPTGRLRIRLPKSQGGTGRYYMSGTATGVNMDRVTLDPDPGVDIWHVGTNTPLLGPGMRLTAPISIRMATPAYTYTLGADNNGDLPSKPQWLTQADAEAPTVYSLAPNTQFLMEFKTVDLTTGALAPAGSTATDTTSASMANISATGFTVGTIPIRPGQELHSLVSLPSNTGSLCVHVETVDGWASFSQPVGGGAVTQRVFVTGFPLQTVAVSNPLASNPAYTFAQSEVGVRVHSPTAFSVLLNHVEAFRIEGLTSPIIRAGWGAGLVGNANPAFISYPTRISNKRSMGSRVLNAVFIGDSITAASNSFSWVNGFKRVLAGVGGMQIGSTLNLAVAGHTAVQQAAVVNATSLSGYNIAMIMVGVNDIAGGSTPTEYIAAIESIINRCRTFNVKPVVSVPTMFYDQALSAPYGNVGTATGNADRGSPYRILLLRKCAELGVQVNTLTIEDTGAVLPVNLGIPGVDPMVQDNIHPSAFMSEILARANAKAAISAASTPVVKDYPVAIIKATWIPAARVAEGYGAGAKPTYGVTGDIFQMGGIMDTPAPVPSTTTVLVLPTAFAPDQLLTFPVACADISGNPLAAATCSVSPSGGVVMYNVPATSRNFYFGSLSWPLRP